MHSGNDPTVKKYSFIESARRIQIMEATVEVLAEVGFINTSFARIADKAGIAPSLISYHFKNKDELTREVFWSISRQRQQHITNEILKCTTATDKLQAALESDLTYMGDRPHYFQALAEIMFASRTDNGALIYMLAERDAKPRTTIRDILVSGQEGGEFGEFDATNLAFIIEAARDSFLAQLPMNPRLDLEKFTPALINFALDSARRSN